VKALSSLSKQSFAAPVLKVILRHRGNLILDSFCDAHVNISKFDEFQKRIAVAESDRLYGLSGGFCQKPFFNKNTGGRQLKRGLLLFVA